MIFYYRILCKWIYVVCYRRYSLLFASIQGRDKESSPDGDSGSDQGHAKVGEVLNLGELGQVNLCLAEGMVVHIEVVGIEGVSDSV